MLSLERLEAITDRPPQRIGLSATQRPLDEIARFLGGQADTGPRPVTIVDAGSRKPLDVEVIVPVDDMNEPGANSRPPSDCRRVRTRRSRSRTRASGPTCTPASSSSSARTAPRSCSATRVAWPSASPRTSTTSRARSSCARTTVRWRASSECRSSPISRRDGLRGDRRHDRASSSASTWAQSISSCWWSRRARWRAACNASAGPATTSASRARARSSRSTAATCSRPPSSSSACAPASSRRCAIRATRSTCSRSRSSRRCAIDEWNVDELLRARAPVRELRRALRGRVPRDARHAGGPLPVRPLQRPAAARGLGPRRRAGYAAVRARSASRCRAAGPSPTAASSVCSCPTAAGSASSTRRWCTRAASASASCSARRRGASKRSPSIGWSSHPRRANRRRPRSGGAIVPAARSSSGRALGALVRELRALPGRPREARLARRRTRRPCGLEPTAVPRRAGRSHRRGSRRPHRSWSSASPTRSATGGSASSRRSARACTRRGRSRSKSGSRAPTCRCRCCGATTASSCGSPSRSTTSRPTSCCPTRRARRPRRRAAAEHVVVRVQVPGERGDVRCCCPAAGRENARRCGNSGNAPPTCSRSPAVIRRFPMLLETTRECLRDVFDVPALREVLTEIRSRKIRVVPVETRRASPFAQSLLFGWIAVYMYEGDAPLAERRATALALDRDLLRDLMGAEELRELLDPAVLAELELELQRLVPDAPGAPRRRPARPVVRSRSAHVGRGERALRDARPATMARRAPRASGASSPLPATSPRRRMPPGFATRSAGRSRKDCRACSPIRSNDRSTISSRGTPGRTCRS